MGRHTTAGRPVGRILAGRAAVLAAGVGTVLGAGAGLASAAPASTTPPQAPNSSTEEGSAATEAAPQQDLGSVSGDGLAALGMPSSVLSGLGSGQGGDEEGSRSKGSGSEGSGSEGSGSEGSGTNQPPTNEAGSSGVPIQE